MKKNPTGKTTNNRPPKKEENKKPPKKEANTGKDQLHSNKQAQNNRQEQQQNNKQAQNNRQEQQQNNKQAQNNRQEQIQAKALEANQIRNLIRNNGRLAVGECEYKLSQPTYNNAQLQEIVRDPSFTAKQAEPLRNGSESKYELRSNNRTAQITIDCKRNNR